MGDDNEGDRIATGAIWIAAGISFMVLAGFVVGVIFGWLRIPFPVG
jgi:hypothetical protein